MHWTYVIACQTPNHFYVGQTNDPHRRIAEHRGHKILWPGSGFVVKHGFGEVVYMEEVGSAKASKVREREVTHALVNDGAVAYSNFSDITKDGRVLLY